MKVLKLLLPDGEHLCPRVATLLIATRVKRDPDNPYNTSFQVPDKNGTTWVPFADVLKNKLEAPLAVLRCCYTGEARPWLGGEVAAVWTSFLLAGCNAVLASPWQVYESQDVSQLIIRFYELWIKDGIPLVQALTLAQREAIRQGLFPAMWGFPLLIGNT